MTSPNILPFEPPPVPARHTRTGFETIPRDLSKGELLRYFTYSPEDRHEIFHCRGASNKAGFALLLGGVRLTGRFPTNFELIGPTLLGHICAQLGLDGMLFLDYPQRQPTRHEHIERLKRYLGLRSFVADDQAVVADFVREQVRAGTPPDDLLEQCEEHLRTQRIVLPGITVLDKLVTTAIMRSICGCKGISRVFHSSAMLTMRSSIAGVKGRRRWCWARSEIDLRSAAWNFIQRRPRSFTAKIPIGVGNTNTFRSISWAIPFNLGGQRIVMGSSS
jgi:hypothetical protein